MLNREVGASYRRGSCEGASFSSLVNNSIQYANLEQVRYPLGHDGTTEIIALSLLTPVAPQKLELRARLYPLRNDPLLQAPAHIDHGTHNGGVSRVRGDLLHERMMELQCV